MTYIGHGMEGKLKAVEFFSGIGGWACAIDRLGLQYDVVKAFDINPMANLVYAFNHTAKPSGKSLDKITAKELDSLAADLWMMSPPCQPHTRNNTTDNRDDRDPRSVSFLNLIAQLETMAKRPQRIILENVVGFEASNCCQQFLAQLSALGYSYEQFILSPVAFGMPNSRPRYYCIAWMSEEEQSCGAEVLAAVPAWTVPAVQPLDHFLEPPGTDMQAYLIERAFVEANAQSCWCWDIARRDSLLTSCFTKAYARYHKGTGSILLDRLAAEPSEVRKRQRTAAPPDGSAEESAARSYDPNWVSQLLDGADGLFLRYLSPTELLRLFGFPPSFSFPCSDQMTRRKCYELIGNSISIVVASVLLDRLMRKNDLGAAVT